MKNKNHKLIVSVKAKNKNKLLLKIFELGINISKINYKKNELEFEVMLEDYFKLKKYLVSYKFNIKGSTGLDKIINIIKTKKVLFLNILLAIILLFIFSNTIISVRVIHSKKYIRDIVASSLEDYGIKKFTWKKNYKELNQIKNKILKKYPKNLEWLEIEKKGMTYIVRVEERIITDIKNDDSKCNLVAKKSGVIRKINYTKGQELKNVGDYVNEGDILISGSIKFNEEVKNSVCANGEVYAEVWYSSNVKLPLNYTKSKTTGKKRYNFAVNDKKIFRSRLKNYVTKKKKLFKVLGVNFVLLSEYEVENKNYKFSEEQALTKALELSNEKIKMKLSEKEHIINQKVLKKDVNNSTMYVEVFTSVEEIISKQENFIEEEKEVE